MKIKRGFRGAACAIASALIGLATVAALASCGGSSTSDGADAGSSNASDVPYVAPTPVTAAPTPTLAPQQEYVYLIDYLNSAIVVFQSATSSSSLTPAELASAAAPLETHFKTFDSGLLSYTWPANTEADVQKLVQVDQALEQDFAQAASGAVTQAGLSSWITKQGSDFNVTQAQAKIVRADLGLGLS